MIQRSVHFDRPAIIYPDSDGQPMAENTLQFEWIVTIKGNLDAQYRDDPNVFVAGDLFWYPVEGDNTIRQAPDTLVVFGRPKGHRGSYRQWEEGGIAPQVVFEILSPGNRAGELIRKFRFYEHYGVEEYYVYDPDYNELAGYLRQNNELREIPHMNGWVSPRLGIRFDLSGPVLVIYRRDGRPFASFMELEEQRAKAQQEAETAQRQAADAQRQAEEARQFAEKLAARLRELGQDPNAL